MLTNQTSPLIDSLFTAVAQNHKDSLITSLRGIELERAKYAIHQVKNEHGNTLIHVACTKAPELLETLLPPGNPWAFDLLAPDFIGATPLHQACQRGQETAVEYLLKQPVPSQLAAKDNTGLTPLHYALIGGHENIARRLVQVDNERQLTNTGNYSEFVIRAVEKGMGDLLEDLLLRGASYHVYDDKGLLPLELAIQQGDSKIINTLSLFGAFSGYVISAEQAAKLFHLSPAPAAPTSKIKWTPDYHFLSASFTTVTTADHQQKLYHADTARRINSEHIYYPGVPIINSAELEKAHTLLQALKTGSLTPETIYTAHQVLFSVVAFNWQHLLKETFPHALVRLFYQLKALKNNSPAESYQQIKDLITEESNRASLTENRLDQLIYHLPFEKIGEDLSKVIPILGENYNNKKQIEQLLMRCVLMQEHGSLARYLAVTATSWTKKISPKNSEKFTHHAYKILIKIDTHDRQLQTTQLALMRIQQQLQTYLMVLEEKSFPSWVRAATGIMSLVETGGGLAGAGFNPGTDEKTVTPILFGVLASVGVIGMVTIYLMKDESEKIFQWLYRHLCVALLPSELKQTYEFIKPLFEMMYNSLAEKEGFEGKQIRAALDNIQRPITTINALIKQIKELDSALSYLIGALKNIVSNDNTEPTSQQPPIVLHEGATALRLWPAASQNPELLDRLAHKKPPLQLAAEAKTAQIQQLSAVASSSHVAIDIPCSFKETNGDTLPPADEETPLIHHKKGRGKLK